MMSIKWNYTHQNYKNVPKKLFNQGIHKTFKFTQINGRTDDSLIDNYIFLLITRFR